MDWMDQYLDSLSDGRNAVYPPDSHTWRPVKPTKQQQSLIQDALVFDLVRMRLIKEARQAEIDAGMGGGYDAGSAAKEGPLVPPIPPIPVIEPESASAYNLLQTFSIPMVFTLNEESYSVDQIGTNNPTITAYRNENYDFIPSNLTAHPLAIRNSISDTSSVAGTYNNDPVLGKTNGEIWFTPNSQTPSSIVYVSVNNTNIYGTIVIKDRT